MKIPTLTEFKAWAKENKKLALAVCQARAFAEVERERVDTYIEPIFEKYGFKKDHDFNGKHKPTMELIKTPMDLYLCNDPRLADFYEETYDAHAAHGWKGERTHCPALVAENLYIQAQNVLLEAGAELLGIEVPYGENRKKMLDLLIGACLAKK